MIFLGFVMVFIGALIRHEDIVSLIAAIFLIVYLVIASKSIVTRRFHDLGYSDRLKGVYLTLTPRSRYLSKLFFWKLLLNKGQDKKNRFDNQ